MHDSIKALEEDLQRVAYWCCSNRLLINPDKTKVLHVGTRQMLNLVPREAVSVNFLGKQLIPVNQVTDLGVIIDAHVSNVASSCMSNLCQVNRIKHLFSTDSLKMIINALVLSKLFYYSSVGANTSDKNIQKLQLVQNFAARIIVGIRKYDHISTGLRQLQWLPVKDTLFYRYSIMTFKCINGLAPGYLVCNCLKRSDIHTRNTRSCNNLNISKFRTTSGGQRSLHE